jgi:predicted nucleotidyltransferase
MYQKQGKIKKDIDNILKYAIIICMDFNTVLNNLVQSLKSSDPYKIILFGSYAKGNPNENSDIDLMVILDNNHVAQTYKERSDKKNYIRNLVLEINREMPLDILVYSKEELKLIKKHGNYFIDEIEKTGRIIYEKAG